MPEPLLCRVQKYICRRQLLRAGDGVAVAVSGGADSVALLHLLLELRNQLGIVISIAHFNHQIRGAAADADQDFARALAEREGLEFHCGRGDAPAHSRKGHLSLEAAARELRYQFFRDLLLCGQCDRLATAHTLDDQAETVLLRLLRGAWTQGLAGIYPEIQVGYEYRVASCGLQDNALPPHPSQLATRNSALIRNSQRAIVRPLLTIQRHELENFLRSRRQPWREDMSNYDLRHSRNRVRHELLPLLEDQYNPSLRQGLADLAEIARDEEAFWRREVYDQTFFEAAEGRAQVPVYDLQSLPVALGRRIVREAAAQAGLPLDFVQTEALLALIRRDTQATKTPRLKLPGNWIAEIKCASVFTAAPATEGTERTQYVLELRRSPTSEMQKLQTNYEYRLPIPGEVAIRRLGILLRGSHVGPGANSAQNRELLNGEKLGESELFVRNWRPGDRFWPAHSKSTRKVKELLQRLHVHHDERPLWPVIVTSQGDLTWMRGFGVAGDWLAPKQAGGIWLREDKID